MEKDSSEFTIRVGDDGMSKTWTKTIRTNTGSKTMRIEQVKNGFIIEFSSDTKNGDGDWRYQCDKYVSAVNPLEIKTPKKGSLAKKVQVYAGQEFFDAFDSAMI